MKFYKELARRVTRNGVPRDIEISKQVSQYAISELSVVRYLTHKNNIKTS